jgi:Ala-tRNA(Pro) deacylase
MSIPQDLADQQIPFETLQYPPAYSSQRRAKYLRVPGRWVLKSVLLHGPSGDCLAILPATERVNTQALAEVLGGPVRLADAEEVARRFADCEWGVAVPFGSRYGLPTYLDASLPADAVLIFPSHFHHEAVRLRCRDFERAERPRRLCLARR